MFLQTASLSNEFAVSGKNEQPAKQKYFSWKSNAQQWLS